MILTNESREASSARGPQSASGVNQDSINVRPWGRASSGTAEMLLRAMLMRLQFPAWGLSGGSALSLTVEPSHLTRSWLPTHRHPEEYGQTAAATATTDASSSIL